MCLLKSSYGGREHAVLLSDLIRIEKVLAFIITICLFG